MDRGINFVYAGSGHDFISDIWYKSTIFGEDGNDTVNGGQSVYGGPGNDILTDGKYVYGEDGFDELYGVKVVGFGGPGDDIITGTSVTNVIDGGLNNDYIDAGNGKDRVIGGKGFDTCTSSNFEFYIDCEDIIPQP